MPSIPNLLSMFLYGCLLSIPQTIFYRAMMTPRAGIRGNALFNYVLLALAHNTSVFFFATFYLKLPVQTLVLFLCVLCGYRAKLGQALFMSLIFQIIDAIGQLLSVVIAFPLFGTSSIDALRNDPRTLITGQTLSLCITIGLLYFTVLLLKRSVFEVPLVDSLKFVLLPLSQMVLLYFFIYSLVYDRKLMSPAASIAVMGGVVIFSLVADGFVFGVIRHAAKSAQLEAQNHALQMEHQMQLAHYTALTEQQQAVRKMRHDILNHLQTMEVLLQTGKSAQAAEYTDEVFQSFSQIDTVDYCAHRVVDAVLHNKIDGANSDGIRTEIQVFASEDMPFSNLDLMCVFSNLMDNAIHACRDVADARERFLRLDAATRGLSYCVELVNAKMGAAAPVTYGTGLNILNDLAQKYHGTLTVEDRGAQFYTRLSLRISVKE